MPETITYLSASQMAERCKKTLRMQDVTYKEAGSELGVGTSSISDACNFAAGESPTKYAALRRRILERYTDLSVGEVSWPVSE